MIGSRERGVIGISGIISSIRNLRVVGSMMVNSINTRIIKRVKTSRFKPFVFTISIQLLLAKLLEY